MSCLYNESGSVEPGRINRLSLQAAAGLGFWALLAVLALTPVLAQADSWRQKVEADWLRQLDVRSKGAKAVKPPTPEEDAAGAVDGIKHGKWGMHTDNEEHPWWQVDLGQTHALGRVVIYNRCDTLSERASRIQVSLSTDGKEFREVYQHDGTVFYGGTDHKPLVVDLGSDEARYLRLTLPAHEYFHLDEVEIYPPATDRNTDRNLALNAKATQSSVSQWSVRHTTAQTDPVRDYPIQAALKRGLALARDQQALGVEVDHHLEQLQALQKEADALPSDAPEAASRALFFKARWATRELALGNPLLSFDKVLFVKRAPGMFPHMSDQFYGWWSRPGGGICILENFRNGEPQVRNLTATMPEGSWMGPELSYDARKILFAACRYYPTLADEQNKADKARVPEDAFYHVYEINVDGSGLKKLTGGKYDDFDARYLPGGDILFLSTRKGTAIQCSQWFSDSTRSSDLPDSYVRCGGDNYRPVPVFTMHAMDPNGRNIRPLSAFENFEWTPSIASDGRILYTRWDYIDRFNGHFFSLWSANQDGTNPQLVYGNYTVKPQVKFEARSIPGSSKLVITAGAHHSISGGSLCILDRARGTEGDAPLRRLTPEVPFPETEAEAGEFFCSPWPLSEDYFLVAWSDQKLPPHCRATEEQNPRNSTGLYLLDAFGNLELLYRDPEISSLCPIPLVPRPEPPRQSTLATQDEEEGRVLVQDVYQGLEGVARGSVKRLRLIAVVPKVQPHMNTPVLGVSAEDPGKFVLGTVPVEPDGSAFFRLPPGIPVFLQALNADGAAVQTMRTLTYAMPGQTLSCVGCHEHRESAPPSGKTALASTRAPSPISPGPEGSWPLRFDQIVQPVLDRNCVECHRDGGKGFETAKVDLTPQRAYNALLAFGGEDLKKKAFERDRSYPNDAVAANSRLWRMLTRGDGHQGVKLDPESLDRLATWLDTYAHRLGHFSDQQEKELIAMRDRLRKFAPRRNRGRNARRLATAANLGKLHSK